MSTMTMGGDAFNLLDKMVPKSISAGVAGIGNAVPERTFLGDLIGEGRANGVASFGAFWDRRSAHMNNGGSVGAFFKNEARTFAGGYMMAKTGECAKEAVKKSWIADVKAYIGFDKFVENAMTGRWSGGNVRR